MKDKRAAKLTSQFDYALRKLGATNDKRYEQRMNSIDNYANSIGYQGGWERNRYGNNKMYRFKKVR